MCQGSIILPQETKLTNADFNLFQRKMKNWDGFAVQANGASGDLAIFWDLQGVVVERSEDSICWISCRVRSPNSDLNFVLVNVYGPNNCIGKWETWMELEIFSLASHHQHIIYGGDFKVILNGKEKFGGICRVNQSQKDFSNWVDRNNLREIHYSNSNYTWSHRR